MTIVNTETGELIDSIGADEARRLTTEAQNEFRSSRDHFEQGWAKVEQAVKGGGHFDLGYRSVGDYLHAEFDGVLAGLDIPSRRIAVRGLYGAGLGIRAIAPVVGVTHKTVVKDLQVVPRVPPEPEAPVVEVDADPALVCTIHHDAACPWDCVGKPAMRDAEPAPSVEPTKTIGIDGKAYPRPARRTQAHRPDAEVLLNLVETEARKAATSANKLTADQIARVKPKADLWTVGLRESVEALQRLLTSLESENE